MKQITEMTEGELLAAADAHAHTDPVPAAAIPDTTVLMAVQRRLRGLCAVYDPFSARPDGWYIAPGTDPAVFLGAIGEHADQIGGAA